MSNSMIYEPRGRAREYAPLACNIYRGCGHACRYCYAPSATVRESHEAFRTAKPRKDFIRKLKRDAAKRQNRGNGGRVLLCFTCDAYQPLDEELALTRETIEILHDTGHHVEILTKGGERALRDIDLLGPHDAFATTLTFPDTFFGREQSNKWEPHAASPAERLEVLEAFHQAGVPTWVSFEPVLYPDGVLSLIAATHTIVDLYKVGKLNADHRLAPPEAKELEASIDWRRFGLDAIETLEALGKPYYIKHDLAAHVTAALDAPHRLTRRQVEAQYRPPEKQPALL